MKEFIEFLRHHKIISKLKKAYLREASSEEDNSFLDKIIEILAKSGEIKASNLDDLASIYEQNVPYHQRKKLGEIYTPYIIVDQILEGVGFDDKNCDGSKSLVDISCGAGSFLVQAVKKITKYHLSAYKSKNDKGLDLIGLKKVIEQVKSSVYGIDINPIGCILCQINILHVVFDFIKQILEKEPTYQIPLFHIKNQNVFSLSFNQKYDFIVGNPPYLFIREIPEDQKRLIERGEFETSHGQYDYYQLFIEIGIKLLNHKGKLGFIVPDSILALSNRRFIRKYIYKHTLIREINYLGPQFNDSIVSNIILILQKEPDNKKRAENIVNINLKKPSDCLSTRIPQRYFQEWNYKFLINLNQKDVKILNFLNKNFPKLKNLMEDPSYSIHIERGVELTKEGKIVHCTVCNKYYPLPKGKLVCKNCNNKLLAKSIEKIIIDEYPENNKTNLAPFIYSINRYQIKKTKYIVLKKPGINYKNPEIYKNRIIIRQLTQDNLICATYGEKGYTSQSLYNLRILRSPVPEFSNFYLLGLLNSELLSFYFIKSFGSYKNLYPRILLEKVKDLPIMIPQAAHEKIISTKISKLIEKLLKLIKTDPNLSAKYLIKINDLIYELYSIKIEERDYIKGFLLRG